MYIFVHLGKSNVKSAPHCRWSLQTAMHLFVSIVTQPKNADHNLEFLFVEVVRDKSGIPMQLASS